jgi:hypothetical protein
MRWRAFFLSPSSIPNFEDCSMGHEPLHRDLLIGAEAIAAEIGIDVRQVYHWLQQGHIPATKTGALWTSTRSALRRHFSGEKVA